jgi:Zn-dependent M28 family amino/carboxypeptidase
MTSSERLSKDVEMLAGVIGERNVNRKSALDGAADYIDKQFREAGYSVERQRYAVEGETVCNLIAEIRGSDEIVVVGGHYDSVIGSPGANDNATGVAATLELARSWSGRKTTRTLRFAAFVNEEPAYFQSADMGSYVYAKRCRERGEKIVGMMSLETMGYYSDEKGSQKYPFPFNLFYPSRGNFIAFVANRASRKLLKRIVKAFRRDAKIPSESVATFESIPGIGWSDQWSFWRHDYPGVMVTDTAPFRYPYYHTPQDTPDKIDYARLALVVEGLGRGLAELDLQQI